jgi:hypothetical protein
LGLYRRQLEGSGGVNDIRILIRVLLLCSLGRGVDTECILLCSVPALWICSLRELAKLQRRQIQFVHNPPLSGVSLRILHAIFPLIKNSGHKRKTSLDLKPPLSIWVAPRDPPYSHLIHIPRQCNNVGTLSAPLFTELGSRRMRDSWGLPLTCATHYPHSFSWALDVVALRLRHTLLKTWPLRPGVFQSMPYALLHCLCHPFLSSSGPAPVPLRHFH